MSSAHCSGNSLIFMNHPWYFPIMQPQIKNRLSQQFLIFLNETSLVSIQDALFFKGNLNRQSFQKCLLRPLLGCKSQKANSHSKAERAILIQFNLESKPAHIMQCFKLTKDTTSNTLDKLRDFFREKKNPTQRRIYRCQFRIRSVSPNNLVGTAKKDGGG